LDRRGRAGGEVNLSSGKIRGIAGLTRLGSLGADILFGWRQVRKHKTASAAAIISLALGMGASLAAFRLVDALFLRPLPVSHPERLSVLTYCPAGVAAGLQFGIGWKDLSPQLPFSARPGGVAMGVQRELMRHASIQTTMNVYGSAMTESKRQAHNKVVEMVLKPAEKQKISEAENLPAAAIGS
jgi:hypothetical protein